MKQSKLINKFFLIALLFAFFNCKNAENKPEVKPVLTIGSKSTDEALLDKVQNRPSTISGKELSQILV
jgi:hypothetical protein